MPNHPSSTHPSELSSQLTFFQCKNVFCTAVLKANSQLAVSHNGLSLLRVFPEVDCTESEGQIGQESIELSTKNS